MKDHAIYSAPPLKELEAESAEMQTATPFQLFASLPRLRGGWFANKSLQPTPVGVVSSAYADHVIAPAWLSLGRRRRRR